MVLGHGRVQLLQQAKGCLAECMRAVVAKGEGMFAGPMCVCELVHGASCCDRARAERPPAVLLVKHGSLPTLVYDALSGNALGCHRASILLSSALFCTFPAMSLHLP